MPSRPPSLRPRKVPADRKLSNWTKRESRQARGYGRAHDLMRVQVLREEPLCRICRAMDPPRITASTIADHVIPKAEGGTDERENYQGICRPCDILKTAAESARARARR